MHLHAGISEKLARRSSPQKLAYTVNLAPGATTRISIEFPAETQNDSQTRMVLTQENLPKKMLPFVQQGTLESFDKLDAVLATQTVSA